MKKPSVATWVMIMSGVAMGGMAMAAYGRMRKRREAAFQRVDLKTSSPRKIFQAGWTGVGSGPFVERMRRLEMQSELHAAAPLLELLDATDGTFLALDHPGLHREAKRQMLQSWAERFVKVAGSFMSDFEIYDMDLVLFEEQYEKWRREPTTERTKATESELPRDLDVVLCRGVPALNLTARFWEDQLCDAAFEELDLRDMLPREVFDCGWNKARSVSAEERMATFPMKSRAHRAKRLQKAIDGMTKMRAMIQEPDVPRIVKRSVASHCFERLGESLGRCVGDQQDTLRVLTNAYIDAVEADGSKVAA